MQFQWLSFLKQISENARTCKVKLEPEVIVSAKTKVIVYCTGQKIKKMDYELFFPQIPKYNNPPEVSSLLMLYCLTKLCLFLIHRAICFACAQYNVLEIFAMLSIVFALAIWHCWWIFLIFFSPNASVLSLNDISELDRIAWSNAISLG